MQLPADPAPDAGDPGAFGRWLRAAREEREITQQNLADRARLSRSYLSDLERGRGVRPTIPALDRLAAALGVSTADVLWAAGILDAPRRGSQRREEDRLLALYRGLSDRGQAAVERFVRFMYQEEQRWEQPAFPDDMLEADTATARRPTIQPISLFEPTSADAADTK